MTVQKDTHAVLWQYSFLKNKRLENLDKIHYRKLLNVILISVRKEEGVLVDLPIVMLKLE